MRQKFVGDRTVGTAEHRAHEQRWCKNTARAADPHRHARGQDLRREQSKQYEDRVVTGDSELQNRVADAVHLRDRQQQQPEQDTARRGTQPLRAVPEPVGDVLAGIQHTYEGEADSGRQHAETCVQHELERRGERERGELQERQAPERRAADRIGGDRAEDHEAERPGLEVAQNQLEREEHTRDGSVERCRDPTGGATRDQQPQLVHGHPRELTRQRA